MNNRPFLLHGSVGKGGFGEVFKCEMMLPSGLQVSRNPATGALVFDKQGRAEVALLQPERPSSVPVPHPLVVPVRATPTEQAEIEEDTSSHLFGVAVERSFRGSRNVAAADEQPSERCYTKSVAAADEQPSERCYTKSVAHQRVPSTSAAATPERCCSGRGGNALEQSSDTMNLALEQSEPAPDTMNFFHVEDSTEKNADGEDGTV